MAYYSVRCLKEFVLKTVSNFYKIKETKCLCTHENSRFVKKVVSYYTNRITESTVAMILVKSMTDENQFH